MTEITLTTKGQFTFNQQLLDHLGVKAGEKVLVKKLPDGSLKIEAEKNQIDILSLSRSMQSDIQATDAELQDSIRQSYIQRGRS
ncbi:hypothetical protein D5041_08685 [Verminephrobacter aporrectodeae subsp. tuberculatae]|uniref:hypothetical protein n=1 Tax=Verminephrobacter aporrectodeae TaxID=1110389 RepID=UPI0022389626|nr:hypothetical protein [Verminephrobacter aporrectodeae]MCW5219846.1 hypothetical protein [Verminephrobacter aporrectodeae subsp. tuberculatae]MCW5289134.1 hypothetical protein [Verminephrobacter aporrectodeae subsp. tuberculatae]